MTTQEAWQKQKELMEHYRKNNPELIICSKARAEAEVFEEIGIKNMPPDRPNGYLRLYYSDFLVEERTQDNQVARLNEIDNEAEIQRGKGEKTLYANLIKIGLTTNAAVDRLSEALSYTGKIGYAGLKDDQAITAQLLAFPDIKQTVQEIQGIKIPNILLTKFRWGKGVIKPGYLAGNIFTITIRTERQIDRSSLELKLENLAKFGFLNYFQSQRFGGIRLISHKIGKLILQGNYDLAIKYLLFKTNEYEMPLIAQLKMQAEKNYPDFNEIEKIFEKLPYSFLYELRAIGHLKNYPTDFVGALSMISDSVTMCLYAYSSLLFNRYLSDRSKSRGVVRERFPLLFSADPADRQFYRKYLDQDNIEDIVEILRPFKFIYWAKRDWAGRVFPLNIKCNVFSGGAVLNFFLPKGAYATTFLANLFELHEEAPVPAWVNQAQIDPKELLGQGSLAEVKEIFKDYWNYKNNLSIAKLRLG